MSITHTPYAADRLFSHKPTFGGGTRSASDSLKLVKSYKRAPTTAALVHCWFACLSLAAHNMPFPFEATATSSYRRRAGCWTSPMTQATDRSSLSNIHNPTLFSVLRKTVINSVRRDSVKSPSVSSKLTLNHALPTVTRTNWNTVG